MNCCDKYEEIDPAGNPREETVVTIPIHRVVQWYRDWRGRKNKLEKDHIQEYEDVVKDYKQDL